MWFLTLPTLHNAEVDLICYAHPGDSAWRRQQGGQEERRSSNDRFMSRVQTDFRAGLVLETVFEWSIDKFEIKRYRPISTRIGNFQQVDKRRRIRIGLSCLQRDLWSPSGNEESYP